MRGARFRDEKLCSCAGWRLNCGGAVITANTVGQPKVIFLLISKNHNKKTDNQKKDFDRTGPPT